MWRIDSQGEYKQKQVDMEATYYSQMRDEKVSHLDSHLASLTAIVE
jgi:hypothetical protein